MDVLGLPEFLLCGLADFDGGHSYLKVEMSLSPMGLMPICGNPDVGIGITLDM